MNTHQFLSVNDPKKPKTAEEINHVLVIRGNKEPNKLRECIREKCKFSDGSHPNNFIIENDVQSGGDSTLHTHGSEKQMDVLTLQTRSGGSSTLQTQVTQPSTKELKG
uniref:Uncharacterized protein n=1 Tax=Panagrolaimus davidi TaxID=227884 RepID=A0A914QXB4_9BILA